MTKMPGLWVGWPDMQGCLRLGVRFGSLRKASCMG